MYSDKFTKLTEATSAASGPGRTAAHLRGVSHDVGVRLEGAKVLRQVRKVPLPAREPRAAQPDAPGGRAVGPGELRGRHELALHKGHRAVAVEVVRGEAAGRVERRRVLGRRQSAVAVHVGEVPKVVLLQRDPARPIQVLIRQDPHKLDICGLPHEAAQVVSVNGAGQQKSRGGRGDLNRRYLQYKLQFERQQRYGLGIIR